MDFWPFLKLQKMDFGQKNFREIDLFDFTIFFAWTYFFPVLDSTVIPTLIT